MNISAVVEEHASNPKVALYHHAGAITYTDLVGRVRRLHAGLAGHGIEPGQRVMLFAGTTPNFVIGLFGILHAGAVAIPANPLSPAPEMQSEIDVVEPHLVLVGPAAAAAFAECDPGCPVVALPGADLDGAIAYDDFVADADPALVERQPSDLAVLLFTSGTAGAPKAAMLTHGNLMANVRQVDAHSTRLATSDDVALAVIPLFHILGLNLLLGVIVRAGASVVLVERFDPSTVIELIGRHGVTAISGPPAMWQALAEHPGATPEQFARVQVAVSGAAGLAREVVQLVQDRLGLTLTQGYGLTEAAPVLTLGAGTGAPPTSVGRPVPGVQLRLVGPDGGDVPVGDEGEIWAKGDNVFPGYWNDPEATARALTPDGWLMTGDIGVVDDDGFLYIVDRSKDLVMVSGFNVYPGEVEAVLRNHHAVAEAAVVGIPDHATGEAVKAFVVPVPGEVLDVSQVIAHCEARMARYKCPQVVEVVDEIPRGSVAGKVRRRQLRDA